MGRYGSYNEVVGRRYDRRLRGIRHSIRRRRKVVGLAGALALGAWIVEQLVGDAVADFISTRLPALYPIFAEILTWAQGNPGHLSVIIFFFVLVLVLVLSYWETRPPSGIALSVAPHRDVRSDLGIWEGVRIINNTGDDLLNCWVDAIEWDTVPELSRRRIRWEVRHDQLDIADGEGNSAYCIYRWNRHFRATLSGMNGPRLPEGVTEIGLSFHANTMDGRTLTMPFWVDVDIQLVADRHEITILEVTL